MRHVRVTPLFFEIYPLLSRVTRDGIYERPLALALRLTSSLFSASYNVTHNPVPLVPPAHEKFLRFSNRGICHLNDNLPENGKREIVLS